MEVFALNSHPKARAATIERLQALKTQRFEIVGVEVTDPEFETMLNHNFDPQHRESAYQGAACQQVADWLANGPNAEVYLRSGPLALVTSKFDLDSLAGMALISYVVGGHTWHDPDVHNRLARIAAGDAFKTARWRLGGLPASAVEAYEPDLQALAHACKTVQFKDPAAAVALVGQWLYYGEFSGQAEQTAEMLEAKAKALAVEPTSVHGGVAFVESTHDFATSVAYRHAPIGACFNPQFKAPATGEIVEKWTIGEWGDNLKRVDFKSLSAALNALEATRWAEPIGAWGGQGKIIGSPFGVSSRLTKSEVLLLIHEHSYKECLYCEAILMLDDNGYCVSCDTPYYL